VRDVVLLLGWAMPAASLAPLADALAAEFRVTTLALPAGATLEAMARAALAHAPARAVWVGWSLGGMVAAQAALLAPARVTALAALATNLSFIARADWPCAMDPVDLSAFSEACAVDPAATRDRFLALQCRGAASVRQDLRQLRALAAEVAVDPAGLAVLRDADLRAPAAALACPSLWCLGEHDALVPAAAAGPIAARVPDARVAVLPGASHVSFLLSPQAVADRLRTFLAETA
jgi:pimeloyl-[acyl-carrier protein] methyl ester esterase